MNKKGIPTFNLILGILGGILAAVVAFLFLSSLYGNYLEIREENADPFIELVGKINKLEDGQLVSMNYRTSFDAFVIGYDKDQTQARFVSGDGGYFSYVPFTDSAIIDLSARTNLVRGVTFEKHRQCGEGGRYACICRCRDRRCVDRGRSCAALQGTERIDGPHFMYLSSEGEVVEEGSQETFFIPGVKDKTVQLDIRREGMTIFINS